MSIVFVHISLKWYARGFDRIVLHLSIDGFMVTIRAYSMWGGGE